MQRQLAPTQDIVKPNYFFQQEIILSKFQDDQKILLYLSNISSKNPKTIRKNEEAKKRKRDVATEKEELSK